VVHDSDTIELANITIISWYNFQQVCRYRVGVESSTMEAGITAIVPAADIMGEGDDYQSATRHQYPYA